jgi:hypothetical protein
MADRVVTQDDRELVVELKSALDLFHGESVVRVDADHMRRILELAEIVTADLDGGSFQSRVDLWLLACFGRAIARNREERNHRFLEEAIELVQALGCTASEAHQLIDYVFGRPIGEPKQEVGGVMVTLAALCLASGLDMYEAGETELARIWTKVEAIRAKQAAKPKHSPLPMHVAQPEPTHQWTPADFLGEVVPAARATPEAWLTAVDDRRWRIEPGEGFETWYRPIHLSPGDEVLFADNLCFGTIVFDIRADGSFTTDRPVPAEADAFVWTADSEMWAGSAEAFAALCGVVTESFDVVVYRIGDGTRLRLAVDDVGAPRFERLD